ncbi:SDR family oxidoreductase [Thermoleophilia bacterium SCSIO 60948]|nr:SDR family oxidoreductase [Thermoleophilia bacterium SCSIO 60948]
MKRLVEMLDLSGGAAIVTGGGRGIGEAICARLCESGAAVLVADLDRASAERVAASLKVVGASAEAIGVDVSDESGVRSMVERCRSRFGSLDIIVNNAGIFPSETVHDMPPADFDRVIDVNLSSVFLTTKYGSEVMKAQGAGGRIINITSIDALHPSMVGLAHYDASKHGVWGFTKNSALELAPYGITVNAVAPGGIATPGVAELQDDDDAAATPEMIEAFLDSIPMHRFGEPDEIARVVAFLASEMSSYMTGSQVVVDGGALLG